MRRAVLSLICAVALAFNPASAFAAQFSGDYLLSMCASDEKGRELTPGGHIACQAYIAGVLDYHNLMRSLGTSPSVDFCVPEGVSIKGLQNAVVRYLSKRRGQHGSFTAAPAVALALFSAYPCKKK